MIFKQTWSLTKSQVIKFSLDLLKPLMICNSANLNRYFTNFKKRLMISEEECSNLILRFFSFNFITPKIISPVIMLISVKRNSLLIFV